MMFLRRLNLPLIRAALGVVICGCASVGLAQEVEPTTPDELVGVDIIENLNAELPLDLVFQDQSGNSIELGELFDGERPVLLQMGYFKCPQLCNLVLNEMTATLQDLEWTTGDEFDVLAISINPDETSELAAAKRTSYVLM